MIYSEPLFNQLSTFLTSVGFGFILCLLYMAVKAAFRLTGKGKLSVMAGDAVFSLLAANISFFYMIISNNGLVRFNLIVGQLVGALVMYFAFGRFIMKYIYPLCDLLHSVLYNLIYPLRVYVRAFYNTFKRIFSKREKKVKIGQRKFKNIAKILLKSENK